MSDEQENLDIPAFLIRKAPSKVVAKSEDTMVRDDDVAVAEVETPEAEAPVRAKKAPAKATAKPAKAAKPVKGAKPAKAPKKATGKPAKAAKPKAELDAYGYREGSLKSKAAAMYASKKGATLDEVKDALGSVQLNLLKDLEGRKFKVRREKEEGSGARKVTRYFLVGK